MSKNPNKQETPEIKTPEAPTTEPKAEAPKPKKFSRRLKTQPVIIENDDGVEENWTITELRGPQRDAVLALIQSFIDKDTKEVKIQGNSSVAAKVLSMSLVGPDGKPMPESDALMLPADMQNELAKEAMALSGLNQEAKEQAKNG